MERKRQIKTDQYGNVCLNKQDAVRALLYGQNLSETILTDEKEYHKFIDNKEKLEVTDTIYSINDLDKITSEEFHNKCVNTWVIPEKYKTLNIKEHLLGLCKNKKEISRVLLEYEMFEERELIPLLQFLMFIVEYMRNNDIVWGVGRGSSVASYCLYLLGVHKVDSIKYDLPIEEFLK